MTGWLGIYCRSHQVPSEGELMCVEEDTAALSCGIGIADEMAGASPPPRLPGLHQRDARGRQPPGNSVPGLPEAATLSIPLNVYLEQYEKGERVLSFVCVQRCVRIQQLKGH